MSQKIKISMLMKNLGVRPEDLKYTFSRSSGPGGQNVNKVNTAVTVRHPPSGISVSASESRSQFMNRQIAIERLLAELQSRKEEKRLSLLARVAKSRRQKARRSRTTKRKLIEEKRHRSETKRLRGKPSD